jgi:hypothetical protein
MRGCFSVLVLGLVFVLAVTWFAGPLLAGAVVERALAGSGFAGQATSVTVAANPPLELLVGHVDRLDVRSRDARIGQLDAARLAITLSDVDLLSRRFGHVDGRLDGVTLRAANGSAVEARSIRLLGPANDATATVTIPGTAVEALAREEIRSQLGLPADDVRLVAPDLIRFNLAGIPAEGRFEVDDTGALNVVANIVGEARFRIVEAGDPLKLRSAVVDGSDVVLVGTLDVAAGLAGAG